MYKYYNSANRRFCSNVNILLTFCMQEFFSSDLLEENHWFPQLLNFVDFFSILWTFFGFCSHFVHSFTHVGEKKSCTALFLDCSRVSGEGTFARLMRTQKPLRLSSNSGRTHLLDGVIYRKNNEKCDNFRRLYFYHLKDRYGVAPTLNVKLWNFEKLKTLPSICQKLDLTQWPKPPLHCSCGHEQWKGGDFLAISSVPDAFVKFSQRPEAPWSLLRGLCWNHRFRPLCSCRPWSLLLNFRSEFQIWFSHLIFRSEFQIWISDLKLRSVKTAKLSKTQQNSDLRDELRSDQFAVQKQQNSANWAKPIPLTHGTSAERYINAKKHDEPRTP